jgi:hypothetical protein
MSIDTSEDDGYLEKMSDQDVAGFRAQAEECRSQADRSVRAADQEARLRMAGEWTKLAEDAERRHGRR